MSNNLERTNNGNKAKNIILKENIRRTDRRRTSAFYNAVNQYTYFIAKPVSFHLKFVMLHNDSLLSQILLSTMV